MGLFIHNTPPEVTPYTQPWRSDRTKDRHLSRSKAGRKSAAMSRRFAGIDGEGWDTDRYGRQAYRLILAADKAGRFNTLTDDGHMSWFKVLHWIANLPREYTYCGYGFGYDTTQILRTLPEECLQSLMKPETREAITDKGRIYKRFAYTPKVEIDGQYWYFGIDYIPRKQLKVVGWHSPNLDTWNHRDPSWTRMKPTVIWDVFSFFQTRFLKAAQDSQIIPPDMLEIIAAGKLRRGDDEQHDFGQEITYCETECKALAMMMENVNTLCAEAGYPLRDFYGAGSVATAMMRIEKTKEHTHPVELPEGVLDACAYAFFGGRFETRLFGYVGNLWEYDINSAYPYVQSLVPCVKHGSWRLTSDKRQIGKYGQIGLAYVRWNWYTYPDGHSSVRPKWAPFMQRSENNGVHSPPSGEGWFCLNEVDAARRWATKSGYTLTIERAWIWSPSCDAHPFAYMAQGYELRKQLKAQGDGRQMVYKLGLNSHSGKCDQTVGSAPWHHPFLASWIKAGCRAMLIDAIALNPDAIAGVATDAVYSTEQLPLPTGDKLGQWSEEYKEGAFMFQPGIGWGTGDDEWVKRRGIARLSPELRQDVVTAFASFGELTTITVEQPIFYGLARNRERYKLGKWGTLPRSVMIGPGSKRYILTDREWASEQERSEVHERLGRPLTPGELPPLSPYVPQAMYDSLPRDGLYGRAGYAYPKFVQFWQCAHLPVASEQEADADERQRMDDETDAILEREWLASNDEL